MRSALVVSVLWLLWGCGHSHPEEKWRAEERRVLNGGSCNPTGGNEAGMWIIQGKVYVCNQEGRWVQKEQ
jgi:hypothetical protein